MVAVSSPAKVLVTGANGYLAVWIVKKYLESGYSVRGTVRCLSKGAFLKERFAEYGERLELVVLEDITKDGAFDEVVKGVDAIVHTASPFHYNAIDPGGRSNRSRNILNVYAVGDAFHTELIVPAVLGTTSILNSALKYGAGVKRIVLTSSVAAMREEDSTPCEYDETSWNKAAIAEVASNGTAAGPIKIYSVSKTLAENAAWKFVAGNKAELAWDLVVINPPWIFGVRFQSPHCRALTGLNFLWPRPKHSRLLAPRRRSTTSTRPSGRSTTRSRVRGEARS